MKITFTYDELFNALSHAMTAEEAASMARDASETDVNMPGNPQQGARGLSYVTEANSQLTDDTLLLLSIQSDELEARVDAYKKEFRAGVPETPAEVEEWRQRREEIKRWADAGYPRDP